MAGVRHTWAALPIIAVVAWFLAAGGGLSSAEPSRGEQAPAPIADTAELSPATSGSAPTPRQPEDPIAAKAYRVLERSCAACHHARAEPFAPPVQQLGHILDLGAISREADLVVAGEPDASRLYTILLTGHPTVDVAAASREAGRGIEAASPDDVAAIREWIATLPPRNGCDDRALIAVEEVHKLASGWLSHIGPERARDTRFVSLLHLYNACTPLADLAGYRQAVQKLLNGLSWAPVAGSVEAIGDGLTLFAIRLSDFGWSGEHWEMLADARRLVPRRWQPPAELAAATGSDAPLLPADWLAHAATGALHQRLLGLPGGIDALARLRGLELSEAALGGNALRAALAASAETRQPRIVERQVSGSGVLWLAHDLKAQAGLEDLAAQPLFPYVREGKPALDISGTRVITALPNGFLAFAVLDAGDTVSAEAQSDGRDAGAGGSGGTRACLGCHAAGLIGADDELRALLESGKRGLATEVATSALSLYASREVMRQSIEDDNFDYRRAQVQAGLDPDLKVRGLDPMLALAMEHERDVALPRLAGELGMEARELERLLSASGGIEGGLAQRMLQGSLPRAVAERLAVALGEATATADFDGERPTPFARREHLSLWTDKRRFAVGEEIVLHASSTADCYLTLVTIDSANRATVLLPNVFEPGNLLEAGSQLTVPGPDAPYRLKASDAGGERFVGICRQDRSIPPGMVHDFERQQFTALGSWPAFVSQSLTGSEAGEARAPSRRSAARRRPRGQAVEASGPEAKPLGTGVEVRAAIRVYVD